MIIEKYYKKKTVLVTGGCGFIGSHLVEALVQLGASVYVIDNLSTGQLKHIERYLPFVTFIKGDILDYQLCFKMVKHVDLIFHLAARTSAPESFLKPLEYHQNNVLGTLHLLDAARQHNTRSLILSSSAAVYGAMTAPQAISEQTPCAPLSPYGYSKLCAEHYCSLYTRCYDLTTICLRYFNVYGPRQKNVLSIFSNQCKKNNPITLYGSGKQTRDFVPVHTVVHANLLTGAAYSTGITNTIFNIGTGQCRSINTILSLIQAYYPHSCSPIHYAHETQYADIEHSQANIDNYATLCTRYNSPPPTPPLTIQESLE
ncbi:MAG: NAD-dependent epimerase/dehydratase family protein [Candidatus Babeliales bacterium]